jgi:GNAT superfamily N-acetyltransferase
MVIVAVTVTVSCVIVHVQHKTRSRSRSRSHVDVVPFDVAVHLDALRRCVVELQDFERSLCSSSCMPRGDAVVDHCVAELLESRQVVCAVEREGGALVGYVAFSDAVDDLIDGSGVHLTVSDLFVHERARGEGVGRRLLNAVEEVAKARSIAAVRVDVLAQNTGALTAYESCGFRPRFVTLEKSFHLEAGARTSQAAQ